MNPDTPTPQQTPAPEQQPTPPPAPQPEVPVQPVQSVAPTPPTQPEQPIAQPPQPQPPKKGLSTGAWVAIIAAAFFGLLITFVLVAAVIYALNGGADTTRDAVDRDSSATSSEKADLTTYKNEDFRFSYPSDWQEKDTSNQTTIIGGVKPDAYVVILSSDKESDVIINYTHNKGTGAPTDTAKAREAMQMATQAQASITGRGLVQMRESTGHGCATNARYTTQPTYQEKGALIGYTYTYACDSLYGPVEGAYGVWYDGKSGEQRLLVSALQDYWTDNQAQLEQILESAEAL